MFSIKSVNKDSPLSINTKTLPMLSPQTDCGQRKEIMQVNVLPWIDWAYQAKQAYAQTHSWTRGSHRSGCMLTGSQNDQMKQYSAISRPVQSLSTCQHIHWIGNGSIFRFVDMLWGVVCFYSLLNNSHVELLVELLNVRRQSLNRGQALTKTYMRQWFFITKLHPDTQLVVKLNGHAYTAPSILGISRLTYSTRNVIRFLK